MDPNDNVGGSAKSSLTKLTSREKVAGGSGGGQNDSGSDNQYNEKPLTRRAEAEAIDRWASREGGSGDCGSGGSGQGTGSGSGSHEGSGSGQRDPNDGEKFRGLSVQLIKAHGGATTMLELSLPEHASEHVVVRRSNSRSAFKGFQNYLKNENKDTAVQMMSVDLTQQHHSFYEASSMMPPSDFAKFYGPIMPKMEMPVPPPIAAVRRYEPILRRRRRRRRGGGVFGRRFSDGSIVYGESVFQRFTNCGRSHPADELEPMPPSVAPRRFDAS